MHTKYRISILSSVQKVQTFRGESEVDEVPGHACPVLDTQVRDVFDKRQPPLGSNLAQCEYAIRIAHPTSSIQILMIINLAQDTMPSE